MTPLQIFLTYAVTWWLVLLMVLPHRAAPPAVPGPGHASGAPERPRIGRKMVWTTGLAIIPTALIYLALGYFNPADAADEIYHAGGAPDKATRCKYRAYHAPADIQARDGVGTGGKTVLPATIGGGNAAATPPVELNINGDNYVHLPQTTPQNQANAAGGVNGGNTSGAANAAAINAPNSYLGLGKVGVSADGTATLDGKPIVPVASDDCGPEGQGQ